MFCLRWILNYGTGLEGSGKKVAPRPPGTMFHDSKLCPRGKNHSEETHLVFELGDIVGSTVDDDPVHSNVQWDRITAASKLGGNNQQSLSLLCLATSSPLNFCSFGC